MHEESAMEPYYWDLSIVPFSMLLLVVYHGYLYHKVKKEPGATSIGLNHIARRAWVLSVMHDNPGRTVLAVQTLRNSIMVSTLMATAALMLSTGMAAIVSSSYQVKQPLSSTIFGPENDVTETAKFITLCCFFIFSFLCYTQAIRFSNHVNFLINIPQPDREAGCGGVVTPEYVARLLARASNFYTVGTRTFVMAVPLLLWLVSPIPVLICAVLLVLFLYQFDFVTSMVV